ncbi:hypothetical protein BH24ACI5_BH24ACI5_16800 [soil metagenome]
MNPNRISVALALAALIIGSSLALAYARGQEMIAAETARRVMQVMIGLMLAAYANVMPKELGQWRSVDAAKRSQAAARVGGWSMTLAGLGYAALWAFAPIPFADVTGMVLIAAATIITLGYVAWTIVQCGRAQGHPADVPVERHT